MDNAQLTINNSEPCAILVKPCGSKIQLIINKSQEARLLKIKFFGISLVSGILY